MKTTATAVGSIVQTFAIDPSHSEVTFQVRHLLTRVRGRFSTFNGEVEFDAVKPVDSKVRFVIDAASIDTNEAKRDAHLRSADFFETDKYPQLTFESSGIVSRGGNEYDVHGNLTIHGVTKAIVLPVSFLGEATDPWGNNRLGFEAETTVNRKDYGLNWNAALETGGFLVGDEVKISLSLQAVAKP